MKRWLQRIAVVVLALLAVVVIAGAVYEALARARAARDFPPPGRLVDVGGGRRIQLDCRGAGFPVVVFESGLDSLGSLSWTATHDAIARTTRACAYSRAGIMWSDSDPRPFSSARVAADLHVALANAREPPPYVMVAHSLGGPYVLAFTGRYGSDVAGVVFVDASHPDQLARLRAAVGKDITPEADTAAIGAALAWSGLLRVPQLITPPPDAPAIVGPASAAWFPPSLAAVVQEMRGVGATLAAAGSHRGLGDRPLVVLSAGENPPPAARRQMQLTAAQGERMATAWRALQDDEATWSTRSRHTVVAKSGHYIQFEQPQVVIDAVRDVVGQVRQHVATGQPARLP